MNKEMRREEILRFVSDQDFISMKELESRLNISMITLRRDIQDLTEKGFVVKTYGGIKKAEAKPSETRFFERLSVNRKAKEQIAQYAMELIQDGDTIFFDTSTTVYALALRCSAERHYLNVVTNGLLTAIELLKNPTFNVTIIGGTATASNFATGGVFAEKLASEISVNKAFFSCSAIHSEEGTFENVPSTGTMKKIVAAASEELVLMVDHTKFNRRSIMKTFDIQQLDYIITDHFDEVLRKRIKSSEHYLHV